METAVSNVMSNVWFWAFVLVTCAFLTLLFSSWLTDGWEPYNRNLDDADRQLFIMFKQSWENGHLFSIFYTRKDLEAFAREEKIAVLTELDRRQIIKLMRDMFNPASGLTPATIKDAIILWKHIKRNPMTSANSFRKT